MGDLVDDLACVLKHAQVPGKSVCIGSVPRFPQVTSLVMLIHRAVPDTIGVALSAGRLDVLVLMSFRVSSLSPFP